MERNGAYFISFSIVNWIYPSVQNVIIPVRVLNPDRDEEGIFKLKNFRNIKDLKLSVYEILISKHYLPYRVLNPDRAYMFS